MQYLILYFLEGISLFMDGYLCCTWQRWNVELEDRVLGTTVSWPTILFTCLHSINLNQRRVPYSKECTSLW